MQSVNRKLCDVKQKETVKIAGFTTISDNLRRRLVELGMTRGAYVTFAGIAPLGDPLIFEVKGSRLALRKNDAAGIQVIS